MESGYEQEPIGGGRVRFTVRPAPVPLATLFPLCASGMAALLVLFVLFVSQARLEPGRPWIFIPLGIAAVFAIASYRVARVWLAARTDRARSPGGSFVVSPTGIEAGPTRIGRESLERLVVGNAMHVRRQTRTRAVSYVLGAVSGGSLIRLAGGMNEATALGLLADVGRILRIGAGPTPPRAGSPGALLIQGIYR